MTIGGERYPGEALDLLRGLAADMAELRQLREEFGPILDGLREGRGLLGMARAARSARNGARDDYPGTHPSTRPGTAPGAGIGPGIWGRARGAPGPDG